MNGFALSPFAAEQYLLDLPPMAERRIAAAIRFRLSALYPGDAGEAAIDFVRNGGSKSAYIVFAAARGRLESCREAAKGRPMISASLVALAMARHGSRAFVSWDAEWAGLDLVEGGKLAFSRRIERKGEARTDLERLLSGTADERPRRVTALLADGSQAAAIRGACAELGLGLEELEAIPFNEAARRIGTSRIAVFPAGPRVRYSRRYALIALACLDLMLAIVLASRCLAAIEEAGDRLESRYLEMQRLNGSSLRLLEELRGKEKSLEEIRRGACPDMYVLVSRIAMNIGEGSRIVGLMVKDGSFQLEAEGRDALTALASLEGSGRFREVKLRQSVPEAGGIERFSISGKYGDDGK